MLILSISTAASAIFTNSYGEVMHLVHAYGYAAIVALLALESASLPIPSEVVLPLVGHFAQMGALNFWAAFLATLVGTAIGISIDYWIAYFIGKGVVYKHLRIFHIKKETLDAFDKWFETNGSLAVFVARLLPLVRGIISLPAGFVGMDLKKFYLYSLAGAAIWDAALMTFGYYTLSRTNTNTVTLSLAAFAVAIIVIYYLGVRAIKGRKN